MKVESGGVATSSGATTVLHKIKVKEEAKECCPTRIQQNSSSAPVAVTSSSSPPPRIGAIATITISNCGSELAAVAKQTASDAFPVDLDLKSRAKAQARDKVPGRDDANGTESRGSSSPSPSSSPSSHYPQASKSQAARANSSSSARSPESDDQSAATLQPLKTEPQTSEDTSSGLAANHRLDESKGDTNGTGGRCISAIFAAHGKLRRLLGTLVQFATDISPDTGDNVRALVLSLLSGSMSAEEFHSALQEATNFPLRGFVLPYLKHNLPSLQRDLSAAARTDSQTCAQYLRANEPAVLEAVGLTESAVELFAPPAPPPPPSAAAAAAAAAVAASTSSLLHHHHHYASAMRPPVTSAAATTAPAHLGFASTHAVKRRASDALYYENGTAFDDGPAYAKRSANPWASHSHHHNQQHHHLAHLSHHQQQQQPAHPDTVPYCWYTQPLHSSLAAAAAAGHPLVPSLVQTAGAGYASLTQSQSHLPPHHGSAPASGSAGSAHSGSDDEWKNIHVMLNCILGMVEKTKRALAILQKRGCTSPAASTSGASGLQAPTPVANGAQSNGPQIENAAADRDGTFKRLSGEIVAQTIRATEDRVAEVKRRAEEAVQEVKRAAMAEVQRAVAAAMAESRASERLRNHRYLDNLPSSQQQQRAQQPIRPNSFHRLTETMSSSRTAAGASSSASANATSSSGDDVDKEPHLSSTAGSTCWNCGRAALETCGGCGIARYCGAFCQHRDWEAGGHHATCRSTSSTVEQQQQPHQERGRSATPSPPRTGSAASDCDANKTATSSSSSASSVRTAK